MTEVDSPDRAATETSHGPTPQNQRSENQDPQTQASLIPAPQTGHPLVDAALADFGQISDHPAAEHHERLQQVSEVLASVLENRHSGAQTSIPGTGPRPQGPSGPPRPGQR